MLGSSSYTGVLLRRWLRELEGFRQDGRAGKTWIAVLAPVRAVSRVAIDPDGTARPLVPGVAAPGLSLADEIRVTSLGEGVVIGTAPTDSMKLRVVLGYADRSGQWHGDARRLVASLAGYRAMEFEL